VFLAAALVTTSCSGGGAGRRNDTRNDPPTLNAIATPQQALATVLLAFQVTAHDREADRITLTATPLPPGATFTDNRNRTGDFELYADFSQIGSTYTITFAANDGFNPPVTQDVEITVATPPNRPPVLDVIPTPQSVAARGNLAFTVSATDLDGDPIALAAAPLPPNATFVDLGGGTGDFDFNPTGAQTGMSCDIDFTADDGNHPPDSQTVTISVTLAPGGTFVEVTPALSFALWAWAVDSADVNADGNVDLVAMDTDPSANALIILLGAGNGTFTPSAESPYTLPAAGTQLPSDLELADLNNDGALDVALVTQDGGNFFVYMGDAPGGTPDGTFTHNAAADRAFGYQEIFYMDGADLTGDGNVDLVIGGVVSPGNVHILLGDGTGSFNLSPQSPIDTSMWAGRGVFPAIGDMDGDAIADIVVVNNEAYIVRVYFGDDDGSGRNGNGTFTEGSGSFNTPLRQPTEPSIADFDRDGNLDIAIAHFESPAVVTTWLGDGAGTFNEASTRPSVGNLAEFSEVGDFNLDGIPDLAVAEAGGFALDVLIGTGTGDFVPASGSPHLLSDSGRHITINDFDNDGIQDIAVTAERTGIVHVFLGN
jgi:hypothetical protein